MPENTSRRARGPYRTGIRRREQLLAAAMDVFARNGYAGGSLRIIAEHAQVSHATLIQHFGSKEGLLTAVLEEWDRQTIESSLTDVSGLDYFRRLPEVMSGHERNRGLLELFTTLAAEASNPAHPAHLFITRRYETNLATLSGHLREAVEAGDIPSLRADQIDTEARLITAALDGIGLQWLIDPTTDVAANITTYVNRAIHSWQTGDPSESAPL